MSLVKSDEQLRLEKQAAYEKQQNLFEEHVKHFEFLDETLERFAQQHSFTLEKNQLHAPCRLLKRNGNPSYVIGIQQEGVWFKIPYRDDLPHTIGVAGHFVDEKEEFVYQKSEEVAYFIHSSTIQPNLSEYLAAALAHIEKWTADVIFREGAKSKHPMAYYRERGGIKIETVE